MVLSAFFNGEEKTNKNRKQTNAPQTGMLDLSGENKHNPLTALHLFMSKELLRNCFICWVTPAKTHRFQDAWDERRDSGCWWLSAQVLRMSHQRESSWRRKQTNQPHVDPRTQKQCIFCKTLHSKKWSGPLQNFSFWAAKSTAQDSAGSTAVQDTCLQCSIRRVIAA